MQRPATVVNVSKGPVNSSIIQDLNLNEEKTVAIYGGLGALPERFLAGGFAEVRALFPKVNFVAVDKADPITDCEKIAARMAKIRLPWKFGYQYVSVNDINLNGGNSLSVGRYSVPIDGVITAVPTSVHLCVAEQWASRGVWVWVDKPTTLIHQVPQIRELAGISSRVFAVDFFLDSDAMRWVLPRFNNLLRQIGKVTALHGRLIESWPVERELAQRV